MIAKLTTRPALTKDLSPEIFTNFYWQKKELLAFCVDLKIPTHGGKLELIERIAYYLKTGLIEPKTILKKQGKLDSDNIITLATPVINYKNDAKTKAFFVSQIGEHFHFNEYLRQFAKTFNDGSLNYGDLVYGWQQIEQNKKLTTEPIGKQFQFNQFQRDFYQHAKGSRSECLSAWKLIRSVAGEPTYAHYLKIMKNL
jgi:hypothetical protein